MRRKLVVGNWKMYGSQRTNAALLQGILSGLAGDGCEVAVCVPAPYLGQCGQLLRGSAIAWGAQDLSAHEEGAYTGEVSASMLTDMGCTLVIVGHSERRNLQGESDETVAAKTARALSTGLTAIVCVGETLAERQVGKTAEVVRRQIDAVLKALGPSDWERLVVAYEPVWAIGTGITAQPEQAQEVHDMLRRRIGEKSPLTASAVRILYGGSVKPDNAAELFGMPDIDGGLIGGASLIAADFIAILNAARRAIPKHSSAESVKE
jgi:triosephosphate isomerase (TIM)